MPRGGRSSGTAPAARGAHVSQDARSGADSYGPVDFIVIGFPGERAAEAVVAAFRHMVASGTVTILDLVFVSKGPDGVVRAIEVQEDGGDGFGFGVVELDVTGLTSSDDLDAVGEMLEPGTSAAVIVVEHTWARGFASAVMSAGGRVLMNERIPATVVNEAAGAVSIQG